MKQKPLLLTFACTVLLFYIVADGILTFTDSRSNAQAVMLMAILIPAVILCWRGNHFAYLFCLVVSAFMLGSPFLAKLNAPDRMLTPADVPVAIVLLLALLSPAVRQYFMGQRSLWQQNMNNKMQIFDNMQPLFARSGQLQERNVNVLFWSRNDEILLFLGSPLKGYRVPDIQQAEQIKSRLLRLQKSNQWLSLAGVIVLFVCGGFYVTHAFNTGEESMLSLLVPMMVMPLFMMVPLMRMLTFQKQIKQQLEPTDLTIKLLQLFELYTAKNSTNNSAMRKNALIIGVGVLLLALLFSVFVSPEIMQKRRADAAAGEYKEAVFESAIDAP